MEKTKRILSFLVALVMVLAIMPINAIVFAIENNEAAEGTQNGSEYPMVGQDEDLPSATVNKLESQTISQYKIFDLVNNKYKGEGTSPLNPQVLMQFIAQDSAAEAANNKYADYTTDFYITIDGVNAETYGEGCYLIGHYGDFGWVVIPLDEVKIENKTYPVITTVGRDFSYLDICTSVKDFRCGIYFSDEFLSANPGVEVSLDLGLSETIEQAKNAEFTKVGETYSYTATDLGLPSATVSVLPDQSITGFEVYDIINKKYLGKNNGTLDPQVLMQFLANDNAQSAANSAFADHIVDFYITMDGLSQPTAGTGCYLIGHYEGYGWVAIPLDSMTVENGTYPVITAVGAKFTYVDICTSVVDFKCGIYFSEEFMAANPNMTVSLELGLSKTFEDAKNANYTVTGDKYTYDVEDLTTVEPVASVNGVDYNTLAEALAAVTDDSQTVVIYKNITENLTGAYLRGNIVTANGAKVTITLTNTDWVYCPYTFVLGENITLNVPNGGIFYYAGGTVIKGAVVTDAYYQMYAGTKLTIQAPGSMTVKSETCIIRYTDDANAGIYIIGDDDDETVELKLDVAYFYQGMINAKDATIVCGTYWQTNDTDGTGSANLVLDNSTLTVTVYDYPAKATGNSTVTLKNGSVMNCANGGFTHGDNAKLDVDATSSIIGLNGEIVMIPVAEVNGVKYADFQEAINAAKNGETVVLLDNIALEKAAVVNGTVVLDLNGKTISGTCNASQSTLILIENGAKLTVKDSAEGGKITFAAGTSNVGWTVDVKGEFVLESGTIELTGSWSIGYAVEIRPNSWGSEYTKASVFTMNGGNIVSSDGAVRVASSSADGHKNVSASFIMNDGTVDAEWDGVFIQQSNTVYDDLSFTMNGGTINSALNPVRVYGPAPTGYVNDQNCMSIVLAGGTMTYTGTETYTWVIDGILRVGGGSSVETILENGTIAVSAEIAQSVAAPEGYEWVANGDAYTLAECEYVAEANGVKYTTLQDAINAGGTVVLLENIVLESGVTVAKGNVVTINLNGKTISATIEEKLTKSFALIQNKGTLTIEGEGKISLAYTNASFGYGMGLYTISNEGGTLNIAGGTIENLTTVGGSMYDAIDNNSTLGNTVLNISGGEIYCGYIAIRQFANSTTCENAVNVTGGKVEGGNCSIWTQNPGSTQPKASIEISEGNFVGRILLGTSANFATAITGGTFTTDVNDLCADGFMCVANGDGTYGIVAKPQINITIAGRTISADTYLQLNLYFANATFAGIKDIYAVVQVGEHEAYVIEYGADGWSVGQNGYAYDALHIKGIAAKEMGDAINIQFFIGNANDDVADVAASDVIVYSIKDYAYAVLGGASFTTEAKRAMYDLLKYGATAQQYFGYNTENLVDAGLTAYSQYARTENTTPNKQNNIEIGANYRLGNTMSLDDSLVLNYYFNTWHTEQYNGKLTAKATYIGWDNAEHVIDIAASEFAYDVDRGMTMIALKGLSGGDVSSDITLEVYDENGTVLYRSIYSIEAYLTAAMAAYPSDAYLYQSIANYGQAMAAYLKQLNNIQ